MRAGQGLEVACTIFLTREYNEQGRYQLRLWDRQTQQFEDVTIDDFIPVRTSDRNPCFARPTGNEAWVLLLEKAMAKYVGSYQGLDGGSPAWALNVLTGHYTCMFLLDGKYARNRGAGPNRTSWSWLRSEPVPADPEADRAEARQPSGCFSYNENDARKYYSHDEMFQVLVYHLDIGNLVAASTGGGSDTQDREGVVLGHAYTVTAAKLVDSKGLGTMNMVQIRNPHGTGGKEWTGSWSDASDLWSQHPEVATALRYEPPRGDSKDGSFWMDFTDFLQHYDSLTYCCANGFDYVEGKEADKQADKVEAFKDPAFPQDHTSLGDFTVTVNGRPMRGPSLNKYIQWRRLKDIAAAEMFRQGTRGLKLFAAGTHPDDIDGTRSGLLVAAACLANKPFAVEELFVSGKLYRPDGAYQVKIYEPSTGKASIEPFDDGIPCLNDNPMTGTKILGSEVWVLLLEKAVAKLLGSYVSVMNARVCWALACLTGEYTCQLLWEDEHKKWLRTTDMVYQRKSSCSFSYTFSPDLRSLVNNDEVFAVFLGQLALGCLAAAETDPRLGEEAMGLAGGSTYSVLDARLVTVDGRPTRLIKLRDPSRQREWRGDWSDHSALWSRHPAVARQLEFRADPANGGGAEPAKRDGAFWMPYEEFLRFFRTIILCSNRLRGNLKPWAVSEDEIREARARMAAARELEQMRAEQEALEDNMSPQVQQQAIVRAAALGGAAPDRAAAATPRRKEPSSKPGPHPAAADVAAAGRVDAGKAVLQRFSKHISSKRVDTRALFASLLKSPRERQLQLLEVPRFLAAAMPGLPKEELWLLMLYVQRQLPYDGGANYEELMDALKADSPPARPARGRAAAPSSSSSSSSGRSGSSSPARSSSGSSSSGGEAYPRRSPPVSPTAVSDVRGASARGVGKSSSSSVGNSFYSNLRGYLHSKKLKFQVLFELFDTDHNGTLDSRQLAALVKRFMPGASAAELDQVLAKLGSGPFTLRQLQERLQVLKPSK